MAEQGFHTSHHDAGLLIEIVALFLKFIDADLVFGKEFVVTIESGCELDDRGFADTLFFTMVLYSADDSIVYADEDEYHDNRPQ